MPGGQASKPTPTPAPGPAPAPAAAMAPAPGPASGSVQDDASSECDSDAATSDEDEDQDDQAGGSAAPNVEVKMYTFKEISASSTIKSQQNFGTMVYSVLDLEEWKECHGISICVIVEAKVTNLLRLMIATEIHDTFSQIGFSKENVIAKFVELQRGFIGSSAAELRYNDSLNKRARLIDVLSKASQAEWLIDGWDKFECRNILLAIERDIFDHISMDRLHEWNEDSVLLADVGGVSLLKVIKDLQSRRDFLKSFLVATEFIDVLRICLIRNIISSLKLSVNELFSLLPNLTNLQSTVRHIVAIRNRTVHESATLNDDERKRLMTHYEYFLNNFDFNRYYPYNANDAVSNFEYRN